jgi:hypothetical protein
MSDYWGEIFKKDLSSYNAVDLVSLTATKIKLNFTTNNMLNYKLNDVYVTDKLVTKVKQAGVSKIKNNFYLDNYYELTELNSTIDYVNIQKYLHNSVNIDFMLLNYFDNSVSSNKHFEYVDLDNE